jgi:hypothetical protein
MVVHTNPSTQEFQASLVYRARPYLKKKINKQTNLGEKKERRKKHEIIKV